MPQPLDLWRSHRLKCAPWQVLARAALHVLTYSGRDADAWVPRDAAVQLRCRTSDRAQHPLYGKWAVPRQRLVLVLDLTGHMIFMSA
jgi:hypothetical protein